MHRVGYRFTSSSLLPSAIRDEAIVISGKSEGAALALPADAEHLLEVEHTDRKQATAIFSLRYGAGLVIFDLHAENEAGAEMPLIERLADPMTRPEEVGALSAANYAMRHDNQRSSSFNITLDDRPVNFDPFNAARVGALLHHLQEIYPGTHIDFGWTPQHTHPSRVYIEELKKFPTGFVWHGLNRHVNHRLIEDPWKEFATGRGLVSRIERRFEVKLQRVMIFPFERAAPGLYPAIAKMGFLACVEEPNPFNFTPNLPEYLKFSTAWTPDPWSDLLVLYRYPAATLTHDRMLAMATMLLPIIAYAHPAELGLGRFHRPSQPHLDSTHFDSILGFAVSKGLQPRSLEEIATDCKASSTTCEIS